MARRRLLALLALVVMGVLGPAQAALAHADLSTSDPEDQAVLEVGPTMITLQFSEPVDVQPDGVTVQAPLDGPLPDGGYVVAWRAVSADGHPVRGAFTFSVGSRAVLRDDLAVEAFADSADQRNETVAGVLRGLSYLGVLGATDAVARFSGWAAVTAGAVAVAGTALGWLTVGAISALTGTTYGRVLLAKIALVVLVLAGAAWNRFRLLPVLAAPEDRVRPWHTLGQVLRFEVG